MNISEEQIEQFFQWIREMPKEEFEERFISKKVPA